MQDCKTSNVMSLNFISVVVTHETFFEDLSFDSHYVYIK